MAVNIGVVEAILRLKDELSPVLDKVNTGWAKFSGGALGATVSLAGLAAGVAVVHKALTAQAEQETAINQLNLALANQGRLTQATSQSLIDYAGELQRTTTFSDDAVLSGQALLASFGMNEQQIKKTTMVAADFASATGTDLRSAIDILGKAFAGNTAMLGRYGIVVDENLTKSQKFEAAVAQLERRFAGSAQAATATYTGQLAMLKNATGEVQEGLGKFLGTLTGGEKPFSMMIDMANKLATFFGVQLVLAFSEARAQLLGMLASFVETTSEFAAAVQKIPGAKMLFPGLDEGAQFAKDFAASLRVAQAEVREAGNQAASGAGKLLEFKNATVSTTPPVRDLAAAMADLSRHELITKAMHASIDEMFDAQRAAIDLEAQLALGTIPTLETLLNPMKRGPDLSKVIAGLASGAITPGIPKEAGVTFGVAFQGGFKTALKDMPQVLMGALQGGGNVGASLGSLFGKSIGESLAKPIGDGIGKLLGDKVGAALGSVIPGLGTAIGALGGKLVGGLIGKLFGGEKKKVEELRQQFISAAGGLDQLKARAAEAGVTLDKVMSANKVKDFEAAVLQLNGAFDVQAQAQEKMHAAIERYGFTIDELGPKWQAQQLDVMAGALYEDYQLLIASGIEQATVIEKMGPAFQEYVNTAIAAGQSIPESMRGPIEKMIEMGLLLDANGNAITSMEDAGITFTQSLTQNMESLIESVDRLVQALTGIGNVKIPTIKVPFEYDQQGGSPGGGNYPKMAEGGIVTRPTMALIGERGPEAVIPLPADGGGLNGAAAVAELTGLRTDLRSLLQTLPRAVRDGVLLAG